MQKHKLTGEGGKGSQRRNSNEKAYADNWDKIFAKKDIKDKDVSTTQIGSKKTQQKT